MKWIAMEPLKPYDEIELSANEESVDYYRFTGQKPLNVEVIGPTELRLLTRVENKENKYTMQGDVNYRVQIRKAGQVVKTFQLTSKRSETTAYKDSSIFVPGEAGEIVLKIPEGKQQFEIVPLDEISLLGTCSSPKRIPTSKNDRCTLTREMPNPTLPF